MHAEQADAPAHIQQSTPCHTCVSLFDTISVLVSHYQISSEIITTSTLPLQSQLQPFSSPYHENSGTISHQNRQTSLMLCNALRHVKQSQEVEWCMHPSSSFWSVQQVPRSCLPTKTPHWERGVAVRSQPLSFTLWKISGALDNT
jgi:hypothetical protein